MNIQTMLKKIIPPNDFQHRHEFSNHHLIDELNDHEKHELENELINKLHADPNDTLIIETLSYIKSKKALPAMRKSFESCESKIEEIIIAVSIYKISYENDMIEIAIKAFEQISNKIDLILAFSYMKGFNDSRVDSRILEYVNDSDFLISYNAKRALER